MNLSFSPPAIPMVYFLNQWIFGPNRLIFIGEFFSIEESFSVVKSKKKILIIDDDEAIRESIKEILRFNDYSVVEANNGVTGLKIYAEDRIDLIILDLFMPRMDGYMFMEQLHQIVDGDPINRKYPLILVITAAEVGFDLGFSHNLGAVEVLQKPYDNDHLLKKIKTILAKKPTV